MNDSIRVSTNSATPAPAASPGQQKNRKGKTLFAMAGLFIVLVVTTGIVVNLQLGALEETTALGEQVAKAHSELQAAQTAVDQRTVVLNTLTESWLDEIRGTGGSGVPGTGAAAQQLAAQREQAEAELRAARAESDEAADAHQALLLKASGQSTSTADYWVIYAMVLSLGVVLIATTITYSRAERRGELADEAAFDSIAGIAGGADGSPATAPAEMWQRNQQRLHQYHSMVVRHARTTRRVTVYVLVCGFLLIIGLGVMTLLAQDMTSTIATSVAAVGGAAVTGFVARTVLRNAETSASEVNEFFRHPIEMERLLFAERLLEMMAEGERDAARHTLIKTLAGGPQDAGQQDGVLPSFTIVPGLHTTGGSGAGQA